MVQRLPYSIPLRWVNIQAVRGQSELLAEAGIAKPTQSELDEHVLLLKRRMITDVGNELCKDQGQPISQGGDAPTGQEALCEPLLHQLDEIRTAGENLDQHLKTNSERLRAVGSVGEPTSNELHDLAHWEQREGGEREMASLLRRHGEYNRIKLGSRPLIH